jgi:hypothetical protein
MEFSNEKYKYNFGLSNALIWHETIINTRQTIVVSGSVVPLTGYRNNVPYFHFILFACPIKYTRVMISGLQNSL